MKKTSKKSRFSRKLGLLLPLLVLATIAAVRAVELHRGEVGHPLSFGTQRHIENVVCSGTCRNVVLVSDQSPGERYFTGTTNTACSEAVVWANSNGREDQIVFGGYEFLDGFQRNLPTQTFGPDALNGVDAEFTLGETGTLFTARIADTGEWNMLESLECNQLSCPGFIRIFTDRDAGREKLYDTCSPASDSIKTYAVYQAPEVHGPFSEDTYLVSVGLRALPSTGSATGWVEGKGFERTYTSTELAPEIIHVVADVGDDTTFTFDLVKDVE